MERKIASELSYWEGETHGSSLGPDEILTGLISCRSWADNHAIVTSWEQQLLHVRRHVGVGLAVPMLTFVPPSLLRLGGAAMDVHTGTVHSSITYPQNQHLLGRSMASLRDRGIHKLPFPGEEGARGRGWGNSQGIEVNMTEIDYISIFKQVGMVALTFSFHTQEAEAEVNRSLGVQD